MKIRPVGVDLFHADGQTNRQTDRHYETNRRFSQFCERAKKHQSQYLCAKTEIDIMHSEKSFLLVTLTSSTPDREKILFLGLLLQKSDEKDLKTSQPTDTEHLS